MKRKQRDDKADRTRARVKKWQARFLAALAKAPSVSHAAKAAGVHRSTCYDARDTDPQFAEQWAEALETSVDGLVVAAFRRALRGSDTLLTFLLRCHRPATYNISHAEQIGEKTDDTFSCRIFYDTQGQGLAELLKFPIDPSMMKQVEGKTSNTGADQALPEATAGEAPPKIAPKHLTGRIHPSWKGNDK